ncbi:MAG: SCO family protein [Ignavibacteriae bacterium]|nr:SCO family protein [Ignavibacteriota bacterium]
MRKILVILFILAAFFNVNAQEKKSQVGIEEHLGQTIPMNLTLIDEYGKPVKLSDLTKGKPFALTLVYFRCPGICSPLLTGFTKTIDLTDLVPGKDYEVITVSFDPTETYLTGSEKKKNYFAQLKNKQLNNEDWRFLTADSATIAQLTDAVGFRYIKKDNEFIHSGVLTLLSPEGKITRYLYGTDFLPLDFKLGIIEAAEGRVGTTISKVVSLCYSYDAEGKRYVLDVTRIAGGGILLLLGVLVVVLIVKKKKN